MGESDCRSHRGHSPRTGKRQGLCRPRHGPTRAKATTPSAIDDCTDAIRLDPKLAEAYNYRGIAYADDGQPDKAIVECRRPSGSTRTTRMRTTTGPGPAIARASTDAAITDYTEAIRLGPGMAHAYWGRVHLLPGDR